MVADFAKEEKRKLFVCLGRLKFQLQNSELEVLEEGLMFKVSVRNQSVKKWIDSRLFETLFFKRYNIEVFSNRGVFCKPLVIKLAFKTNNNKPVQVGAFLGFLVNGKVHHLYLDGVFF